VPTGNGGTTKWLIQNNFFQFIAARRSESPHTRSEWAFGLLCGSRSNNQRSGPFMRCGRRPRIPRGRDRQLPRIPGADAGSEAARSHGGIAKSQATEADRYRPKSNRGPQPHRHREDGGKFLRRARKGILPTHWLTLPTGLSFCCFAILPALLVALYVKRHTGDPKRTRVRTSCPISY
jgi:hypothetical protein